MKEKLKQEVMTTFKRIEKLKRHELKQLFEDIYGGEEPWNIVSSCSRLLHPKLNTCSERTTRRVISTPAEVWVGLEAVETGVGQVQGRRERTDRQVTLGRQHGAFRACIGT